MCRYYCCLHFADEERLKKATGLAPKLPGFAEKPWDGECVNSRWQQCPWSARLSPTVPKKQGQ